MHVSRFTAPLFVVACVVSAIAATDVTGTWRGPMDAGGEAIFHLKADDKGVAGSMVGADGKDYPVSSGKLDGDKISMTVDSKYQDMPVKLIVTGTVAGDQMKLHIASDNGYWQTDATVKREAK
jgi:hypothetical protein